jgi:hypothetical protein
LIAFPQEIRFQISSLKVSSGRVDLNLQVRTAVDAGNLAMALKSHGFEVEPPVTTRKDATTFDSVLKARWLPVSESPSLAAPASQDAAPTVDAPSVDDGPSETLPVETLPVDTLPVDTLPVDTLPGDPVPVGEPT